MSKLFSVGDIQSPDELTGMKEKEGKKVRWREKRESKDKGLTGEKRERGEVKW